MFLVTGLLMCLSPALIVDHVLDGYSQAASLFPNSYSEQTRFTAIRGLGVMSVGLVCLLTSWGLRMGWGWAIWTGRLASLVLLLGFPWLTPVGAIGLYFLFASPPPPVPKSVDDSGDAEFWSRKHNSPLRWFPSVIWGTIYMAGWIWVRTYNQRTLA
jgi:hypothetical protein